MPETFRVNLFRNALPLQNVGDVGENVGDSSVKFGEKGTEMGAEAQKGTEKGSKRSPDTNTKTDTNTNTNTKTDTNTNTDKIIIELLREKPESTLEDMMNATGLSKSGVRYALNKLRESGMVTREGTRKNGKWIVR